MSLKFDQAGLIPAIIQDSDSREVLMLGYMNEEAYAVTLETGLVTFYSRSKQRLWTKGEESGNVLELVDLKEDCDKDALLVTAKPKGPTCHKGTTTCWGDVNRTNFGIIEELEKVIADRKANSEQDSYVASLFRKGINKIAQKVGEEAVEVVIEAKDNDANLFLNESADLFFHYLILLQAKSFTITDVLKVLNERKRT